MIMPASNLLVYAYNEHDSLHSAASRWWNELIGGDEEIGIPWIVTIAFIRVSTNPRALPQPLTTQRAVEVVQEWFTHSHVSRLEAGESHLSVFTELLLESGTRGNLVNDAHIAALAIEHDAEVHSNDSDFSRFPGLRWRNPIPSSA